MILWPMPNFDISIIILLLVSGRSGVCIMTSLVKTFSALLALCEGNRRSPLDPPPPPQTQRPNTRNFDVFFDLCLNKWLSKQSSRRWFEMPSRPLWRHSNVYPWRVRIIKLECLPWDKLLYVPWSDPSSLWPKDVPVVHIGMSLALLWHSRVEWDSQARWIAAICYHRINQFHKCGCP